MIEIRVTDIELYGWFRALFLWGKKSRSSICDVIANYIDTYLLSFYFQFHFDLFFIFFTFDFSLIGGIVCLKAKLLLIHCLERDVSEDEDNDARNFPTRNSSENSAVVVVVFRSELIHVTSLSSFEWIFISYVNFQIKTNVIIWKFTFFVHLGTAREEITRKTRKKS